MCSLCLKRLDRFVQARDAPRRLIAVNDSLADQSVDHANGRAEVLHRLGVVARFDSRIQLLDLATHLRPVMTITRPALNVLAITLLCIFVISHMHSSPGQPCILGQRRAIYLG